MMTYCALFDHLILFRGRSALILIWGSAATSFAERTYPSIISIRIFACFLFSQYFKFN